MRDAAAWCVQQEVLLGLRTAQRQRAGVHPERPAAAGLVVRQDGLPEGQPADSYLADRADPLRGTGDPAPRAVEAGKKSP
jgi:hypothetical protein